MTLQAIVQAGLSVEEVVAIVERELDRRNADADKRADENRKAILDRYEHLYPDLLQLRVGIYFLRFYLLTKGFFAD